MNRPIRVFPIIPCHAFKVSELIPRVSSVTCVIKEYGYFDKRITFRWGLLSPTTKFRRDILFSFEDLVVSFGGTLSLFLGMSFISLIETVFLIFENVYTYYKL